MKTKLLTILSAIVLLSTGCVKTIASEDGISIPYSYHSQAVGASANDLLSDENYNSLTIEVQYMKGAQPDSASLDNMVAFLYKHTHKPKGIRIITKEIPAAADGTLNLQQVNDIEKTYRTSFSRNKDLSIYVLYTNGYYTDRNFLGWAYRNSSIVIFGKRILESSDEAGKPSRTKLESTVLHHELGHLLGLVNVGSPLQSDHKDDDHGKHCSNTDCLMYYRIGVNESISLLLKKGIPQLDPECLADLRANGGR